MSAMRRGVVMSWAGIALLLVGAGILLQRTLPRADLPYLFPEAGARWIHYRNPEIEVYIGDGTFVTGFRKSFTLDRPVTDASLTFRAMKKAQILLDGNRIAETADDASWNQFRTLDLPSPLAAGHHELLIVVTTRNGPQCLLAYSDALGLVTDDTWEASRDAKTWSAAIEVDAPHAYTVARRFGRADKALLSLAPLLVPLFLVVAFGHLWWSRKPRPLPAILQPGTTRWILIALWMILGVNNTLKLPMSLGFDIEGHVEYLQYVASQWRVPLAPEGWTMFQAPLFYMLCAPIYRALTLIWTDDTALRALRLVPLLCGAAQIELCYRAVRILWRDHPDLQSIGTVLGGLLPLHTYIAQYFGNEPLCGLFTGLAVVMALRCMLTGSSTGSLLIMGVALGTALLSKVTAVLLVPPLVFALAVSSRDPGSNTTRWATAVAKRWTIVFGTAFLIAGWYYLRNWIILGRPFFGGWEPERGIIWWQDPGYRTARQFTSFGTALFYPVCANMRGFWDGVYSTFWADGLLSAALDYDKRPPWNYPFMLAGTWLGLVPTLVIAVGAGRTLTACGPQRHALAFATSCVALFVAGILYTFATVPYYCVVKASYMTGLLPCFALLGAGGFEALGRRRMVRAILYGAFACWAVAAYAAYFVW